MSGTARLKSSRVELVPSPSRARICRRNLAPNRPPSRQLPLKSWLRPSRLYAWQGGATMRLVASPHVWARLPIEERDAVAEAIVRVLTAEVEHERFSEGPTHPSVSSGSHRHSPIRPQAGRSAPRERPQSARPSRTSPRAGLAEGPDLPGGRRPRTVRQAHGGP